MKLTSYTTILIFFGTLLLFGCDVKKEEKLSLEKDFKTIEVADLYSIKVPNYMTETESLNDEASVQVWSIFKETYCIVIEDVKEEFISTFKMIDLYDEDKSVLINYAEMQYAAMSENLEVLSETEMITTKINGADAIMLSMDSDKSLSVPTEITYFLTFIEGKENIYLVLTWTLREKKHRYRDTFNKIANSFKLKK
ncbi:MAG: hypothetical protein WBA74_10180 [Cyclobacteriaceae bacterium]